jgi:nicotinamide mononucleotide (NMN) deamidase PncC
VSSAEQILDRLLSQGKKLVVAESLTGGLLTAEFSKVAGASEV